MKRDLRRRVDQNGELAVMQEPVIVGISPAIKKLIDFIKKAAKSNANAMILGETGTGKELAARMVHLLSERKDGPFIKINCANLNENLLESELFGYRKGAFTGAYFDKPGLIEEADGGTFFFDEIGDITPYVQAKLLEVIEQKKIRRLSENTHREVDVRFIFATNKDLVSLIKAGKFRQDLYYRINVLSVSILRLGKRKEDIPILVDQILSRLNLKYKEIKHISPCVSNRLMKYDYPGNVRELENIIERAYVNTQSNIIKSEDIIIDNDISAPTVRREVNLEIIRQEIKRCHGNKSKTARKLGISRQWLHRLLKKKL